MLDLESNTLIESVTEALETMGFISAWPAADHDEAPPDPVIVRLAYRGAGDGQMEMVAPAKLGAELCANMLVELSDDADEAQRQSHDALAELHNICCGLLLGRMKADGPGSIEMQLPRLDPFDPRGWRAFINRTNVSVLDFDGGRLAFAVRDGAGDDTAI